MGKKISAVILAAGSGKRMNSSVTKQRMSICGESLLHRSVRAFSNSDTVESVIVVVRADELDFAKDECREFSKVKKIIEGGGTRFESARLGFCEAKKYSDYVAIHDGARCLVTPEIIEKVANDAFKYGAATASSLITDTIKSVDRELMISNTVDRSSLRAVQTPQIFRTDLYTMALEKNSLSPELITDDNMLFENIGVNVYCTDTGKHNIKITTQEDILLAEFLINGDNKNA